MQRECFLRGWRSGSCHHSRPSVVTDTHACTQESEIQCGACVCVNVSVPVAKLLVEAQQGHVFLIRPRACTIVSRVSSETTPTVCCWLHPSVPFFTSGLRWLYHRSRHCLPMRPASLEAISHHRIRPSGRASIAFAMRTTTASSSGLQGPLCRPG